MTDTSTQTTRDLVFEKQENGYNKTQVDIYISSLTNAYQTAYNEYTTLCDKYNGLLVEYKDLKEKAQSTPNAGIIAKALVDAELFAQKIISDSNIEAARITTNALADAKKIKDESLSGRAALEAQAEGLIDKAHSEAHRIITQADKNRERAEDAIKRVIEELSGLLIPVANGTCVPQLQEPPVLITAEIFQPEELCV